MDTHDDPWPADGWHWYTDDHMVELSHHIPGEGQATPAPWVPAYVVGDQVTLCVPVVGGRARDIAPHLYSEDELRDCGRQWRPMVTP